MRAVGYIRVSTNEQERKGLSLDAQKRAIAAEAERHGWELADLAHDTMTARQPRKKPRPGFELVLERLDAGDYGALIVSRLDRAWRSVGHFAATMDRAERNGWVLVVLKPAVDMSEPFGRAMAQMAAVWAELEGALISQRTSDGIREGYASGRITPPQPEVSDLAVRRILQLDKKGETQRAIARALTIEGVASPRGGAWHHSTVGVVLRRENQAA